jgi:hypothetical protein
LDAFDLAERCFWGADDDGNWKVWRAVVEDHETTGCLVLYWCVSWRRWVNMTISGFQYEASEQGTSFLEGRSELGADWLFFDS